MNYRPITDIWILARPKVKYYGAYPNGFLERARALLGITPFDALLHVCGGMAHQYPAKPRGFGPSDRRLDLDPQLEPDYIQAATDALPPYHHSGLGSQPALAIPRHEGIEWLGWPAILADPPYTLDDAEQYRANRAEKAADAGLKLALLEKLVARVKADPEALPKLEALVRGILEPSPVVHFPAANRILRNMLDAVRPGGRVGMLHYVLPQPPNYKNKGGPEYRVRFVACVGVIVGYNNRMRTFSVFEREG